MSKRKSNDRPFDLDYFFERSTPEPSTGCWIWSRARFPNGYGAVRINGRTTRAHRAVYQAAHNVTLPSAVDVCHTCDVRACVNPDHLFVGTRLDNMRDCAEKGRIVVPNLRGDDCPASKLTSSQVLAIRNDMRGSRVIAKEYGVTHGAILAIRRRETWAHL